MIPPLCPHTIRRCIEALPEESDSEKTNERDTAINQCVAALEALLPAPDPAKELVEQWCLAVGADLDSPAATNVKMFLAHLIQSGKIEVKG